MHNFKTNKKYYPLAITKNGIVKNLKTGNIRTQVLNKRNGYLYVGTRDKTFSVHRMLAELWIENPDNLPQVNHIDGIKTNNTVANLEWVSVSENALHAHSLGLLKTENRKRGEECNLTSYPETLIISICEDLSSGMRDIEVEKKYNMKRTYIKELKAGKLWKHITKNYKFHGRRNTLSEETVRWVCERLVEGKGNTEILKMSTNKNLKLSQIKAIKYKTAYKEISKNYF